MPTDLELTARSRATRDKLLVVARQVFEADGYDGASVSRIVELAEVSRGTFYLYFESKEDVFRTVASALSFQAVGLQRTAKRRTESLDLLRDVIGGYVARYRENALFMAVLEQVATHEPAFRALRREMRRGVAEAAIDFVARLQRRREIPSTVDPRYAGVALTGMVDRFLYVWLVLGEEFDEDEAVENLARLWLQAIGGTVPDR